MGHTKSHNKKRTTATVGKTVSIPGNARAITVSELTPFGNSVQVSWLEPVDDKSKMTNEFEIHADKRDFIDENPVPIPNHAVGTTIWEPSNSSDSTVYWLY